MLGPANPIRSPLLLEGAIPPLFTADIPSHGDLLMSPDISCQSYGNLSSQMHVGVFNTDVYTLKCRVTVLTHANMD